MSTLANLSVGLVALLHVYFLVLEMFFWDKPLGLRTFRLTPEFAQTSKALAANQGLYNSRSGVVLGSVTRHVRRRDQSFLFVLRDRSRAVWRIQCGKENPMGAGCTRTDCVGVGVG